VRGAYLVRKSQVRAQGLWRLKREADLRVLEQQSPCDWGMWAGDTVRGTSSHGGEAAGLVGGSWQWRGTSDGD
jgi:hypothetical protein